MEQYISKSAVVAEIERKKEYYENIQMIKPVYESNIEDFNELLSFIDTLEVKEVDLEKELDTWRHNHFHGRRDIFANGEYLERVSQLDIAKHFFELGLKTKQTTI